MTFERWLENRWLVEHRPTAGEVERLFSIIDRDLRNAAVGGLSPDWRLVIAYNAALQCAMAALAATGYRPSKGVSQHYYAIESLRMTLSVEDAEVLALNAFRKKRNIADYERAGTVSETEVGELLALARSLRSRLVAWLGREHPGLLPEGLAQRGSAHE